MHLLRCLTFLEAQFSFYIFSTHIKGEHNTLADALSRNKRDLFLSMSPQAHREPTTIPVVFAGRHRGLKTRLDIPSLDAAVEFFCRNSIAESTQRSYDSASRRYLHFCMHHNIHPIPVSEHHLCQYVSYLALAPRSIS